MDLALQLFLLCLAGLLSTVTPQNVCSRPPPMNGWELKKGHTFFEPGMEVTLNCIHGYTYESGRRKTTCKMDGEWTEIDLKCSPKRCSAPQTPQNGQAEYNGITYMSIIMYSCNEGYNLFGANSSICLHTAQWSEPTPVCHPVMCSTPPLPLLSKVVYDKRPTIKGIEFGSGVTYHCRHPMVLFGNNRAVCQADGTWTDPPECRLVICPPPSTIENGFLSFALHQNYGYMETVRYGCNQSYVLDGTVEVMCEKTGLWGPLPACRAPCKVNIQRGRVEYKKSRMWIENFQPNQVLHTEEVVVFCLNKEMHCGYPVSMYCNNGNIATPPCYEEPSFLRYSLNKSSLPSEIQQCP